MKTAVHVSTFSINKIFLIHFPIYYLNRRCAGLCDHQSTVVFFLYLTFVLRMNDIFSKSYIMPLKNLSFFRDLRLFFLHLEFYHYHFYLHNRSNNRRRRLQTAEVLPRESPVDVLRSRRGQRRFHALQNCHHPGQEIYHADHLLRKGQRWIVDDSLRGQ